MSDDDIVNNVLSWADGKEVPPSLPEGIFPTVGERDPLEMEVSEAIAFADDDPVMGVSTLPKIYGLGCVLVYSGGSMPGEYRRISCVSLKEQKGNIYLYAKCHERRDFRCFRLDRMDAVIDVETGEVFERPEPGPETFFSRFGLVRSAESESGWGMENANLETLIAGINVMAFMARCDGFFSSDERQVLADYIRFAAPRVSVNGDFDPQALLAYSQRVTPDSQIFVGSVRSLYRSNKAFLRLTLDMIDDLVRADGIVEQAEADLIIQMRGLLSDIEARRR